MISYTGLKHLSKLTEWILICYKPICGYSGCVLCKHRWQTDGALCCTNSSTRRPKSTHMDSLLWHMDINDLSDIKQKLFTFKHSLNKGIHSSLSKISMRNSVIRALLTRIRLIKECVIFSFKLRISVSFWALITMPAW